MAAVDQVSGIAGGATGTPLGSVTGVLQGGINNIMNMGGNFLDRIFPPAKREEAKAKLTKFATEKPYLASFLLSQIALSGLPLFLFITMTLAVAIFALLAGLLVGLLGAILFILAAVGFALVILLPTLFFTTFAATAVWLWGVGAYYIIKWFNEKDVPGIHVPMSESLMKATGLDGLTNGLGGGKSGSNAQAAASGPQDTKSHAQANGSAEKDSPRHEGKHKKQQQHNSTQKGDGGAAENITGPVQAVSSNATKLVGI